MIPKIFFTTLLLFISYNLWLHYRPIPTGNQVYSYWVKENHAKAQKYLQPNYTPNVVLCGSSLTSIMTPWLNDSIFDLSAVGGSWQTGLEIVHRSNKTPQIVGIEVNFLMRGEDTYITRDVFESNWITVRKAFPSFHAFNQPMDIITTEWQKVLVRRKISNSQSNHLIFNSVYPIREKEYQEIADSSRAMEMVNYISSISKNLEKRGCRTFLYLMPMDSALLNSPRINNFIEQVGKLKIPFIIPNRNYKWKTVDSEHLTAEHALLYANILGKKIVNYNKIQND